MLLSDLQKSISEMSREELEAQIHALRNRRRRSAQTGEKKVVASRAKSTSMLHQNLDKIGEDGLAGLLAILEAKKANATKSNTD